MMQHALICYIVAYVGENALANMDNLQTVYSIMLIQLMRALSKMMLDFLAFRFQSIYVIFQMNALWHVCYESSKSKYEEVYNSHYPS